MDPIVIKVDRDIILKQHSIENSEILFDLVNQDRESLKEWLPWVDLTQTVDDSEKFIKAMDEAWEEGRAFELGIWYKEQLVGSIGIHDYKERDKSTAIGYWLSKSFWGEGIMTRSVKGLINFLFAEMKLNRIEIRCAIDNERSNAIPKRLGFKFEGVLRQAEKFPDHFNNLNVYSILASEWKS